MLTNVNFWAVLLAMLSTMVVGTVWYTPKVFGTTWMRLAKIDPSKQGSAVVPILITLVVSFLSAWMLAVVVQLAYAANAGSSYLAVALLVSVLVWIGFVAARFITHDAFEGRPGSLTILNIAHELVTFVVMGLIIGVWPPAL
ncbi:MAG TPA: DUF1761 domain-containing protein [Candidatus Lumbricidophila sp.]|nr:DUF1761 domain-containing protein [Candidatus Lumbricidophila sp.]